MRSSVGLGVFFLLLSPPLATGGPNALHTYSALELIEIENQRNEKGQKLPDEYIPKLREEILYSIVGLHLFHRVEDHVDSAVAEAKPERVVQLKVSIVGYSGAQNNARVTALVSFTDKDDKKEVLQKKVDARLFYDQGALTSAMRKLARSISNLVRDNW